LDASPPGSDAAGADAVSPNPDGSVGPGGETGAGGSDGGASDGALVVTHLVCEYLTDPLGIDTPQPRLSWALESSGRGQKQTAYEIVASSASGDVWSTGKWFRTSKRTSRTRDSRSCRGSA
jgi:alpha-L-rhamnosidase